MTYSTNTLFHGHDNLTLYLVITTIIKFKLISIVTITRLYKIKPSNTCRYEGKIKSKKHNRRNSDIPEELIITCRKDAR